MRIVLDCNVVVSAGITRGTCYSAIREVVLHHTAVLTSHILSEYESVIARPKFELFHGRLQGILLAIREAGVFFDAGEFPVSLPDPFDEIYLIAALSSRADILITGNCKDFPEELCHGVRICTPREFMRLTGNS